MMNTPWPPRPNAISRPSGDHAGLALGKFDEAERLHRAGLVIVEAAFGPHYPDLPRLEDQALMLRKLKRKSEAKQFENRARLVRDSASPAGWPGHTIDVAEPSRGGSSR